MATVEPYTLRSGGTRYRVRYRTPDGRQTDKRGFTTQRAARSFAASVATDVARGQFISHRDGQTRLADLGPAWLARQAAHLKPSSERAADIGWRIHVEPRWGATAVGQIRHSDVGAWVADLAGRMSAASVQRAHGVLAGILDAAVKDRLILSNPARGVKLPRKVKRQHTYLSHDQVRALADAAGDRSALVLLLAYCGLRYGEVAGLVVGDVDLLRRRVTVARNATQVGTDIVVGTPKNHRRRTVPIPALLVEPLARCCEGKARDGLLFTGPTGGHLRPSHSTTGWFEYARVRADLPRLTPHDLRHTAASLAVSAGANVKAVQRMLGHASAVMTLDTYADLFDDDLQAVADRLDAAAAASVGKVWARTGAGPAS